MSPLEQAHGVAAILVGVATPSRIRCEDSQLDCVAEAVATHGGNFEAVLRRLYERQELTDWDLYVSELVNEWDRRETTAKIRGAGLAALRQFDGKLRAQESQLDSIATQVERIRDERRELLGQVDRLANLFCLVPVQQEAA